jgi:serine/threonine protein kinase
MTKRIGPYELLDRISSGGMGEIYLARLTREGGFQKVVALKRILPHLAREANFIKMFEAEARLSAQLNHANVVHVYDYGRDADGAWIAMEYVDGYDLRGALDLAGAPEKGLPAGLALLILESCAAALDYAYRRKGTDGNPLRIIHRDMSPQNVLLSLEGEVKITDFGLAKACSLDTWSLSGMLKGKLAYMAPEQVMSGQVDSRSDIFATGVVLYEMISGRRVYPADTAVARLMDRVRRADFEPLGSVAPDTAPELLALVDRCLAERPEDRFQTASDLAVEARRVATGLGCLAAIQDLAVFVRALNPDRVSPADSLGDGTAISDRPIAMDATQVVPSNAPDAKTRLEDEAAGVADTMALSASDLGVIKGDDAPPPKGLLLPALVAIAALAALIWWFQPAQTETEGPAERPAVTATPLSGPRVDAAETPAETTKNATLTFAVTPRNARCHVRPLMSKDTLSVSCIEPLPLKPGPYLVTANADGYQLSDSQVIELQVGEEQSFSTVLKPVAAKPCNVRVLSEPEGARVTLDGKKLSDRTPLWLNDVSPGKHAIELRLAKHALQGGEFTCDATLGDSLSYTLTQIFMRMDLNGKRLSKRPVGGTWHRKNIRVGDRDVKVTAVSGLKKSTITIHATPWATLWLGKRSLGDSPRSFKLTNGVLHKITFKRAGVILGTLRLKIAADK